MAVHENAGAYVRLTKNYSAGLGSL